MALAEHGRSGDVGGLGLVDGQPHRPLVGDIAEPPMAIDDSRRRRFLHDRPRRTGDDVPGLDPVDIGRDLDDAVRIMADEVGGDDVAHDKLGLGRRRSRRLEQGLADFDQPLGERFSALFPSLVDFAPIIASSRTACMSSSHRDATFDEASGGCSNAEQRLRSSRKQRLCEPRRQTRTSAVEMPGHCQRRSLFINLGRSPLLLRNWEGIGTRANAKRSRRGRSGVERSQREPGGRRTSHP